MESFNETVYRSKSNKELKEFCKANHIVGITGKNKDGLIALIKEHFDKKKQKSQDLTPQIQERLSRYCICGRREVQGETGCSRWPACADSDSEDGFY